MSDIDTPPPKPPTYLGDGAYVQFDGFGFWLTTSDGIRTTNAVYLEPGPLAVFEKFVAETRAKLADSEKPR